MGKSWSVNDECDASSVCSTCPGAGMLLQPRSAWITGTLFSNTFHTLVRVLVVQRCSNMISTLFATQVLFARQLDAPWALAACQTTHAHNTLRLRRAARQPTCTQ